MNYKRSSLQPIIQVLQTGETLSPTEISFLLKKSKTIVHKYLKVLLKLNEIEKIGKGTHAKYRLKNLENIDPPKQIEDNLPYYIIDTIDKEFLKFAANGEKLVGYKGFVKWCQTRSLNMENKAKQFYKIHEHIQTIQDDCGMLEVTDSFKKNINPTHIDKLYYADQYKWMEFGRGKLAEITFYAKQSQNIIMLEESMNLFWNKLTCLIKKTKPNAIALTPHSIKRTYQIIQILWHRLKKLDIPFISLIKYFPHKIPIPQKSLKTRKQRIQNAKETILINSHSIVSKYPKILLIDDFVGSGATLNETAYKLKNNGAKTIIGFAFVGNANLSYDVINEI